MQLHLWMEEASCRKRRNDFWYPPLDTDVPDNYYAIGREVCHRCPVWDKCLDAGIDEKWGMWGGLTPQERTVIVTTRCSDCIDGHNQPTNKININVIPKHGEPVQDLEMLRFNLLST
jgi:hypothetical protein